MTKLWSILCIFKFFLNDEKSNNHMYIFKKNVILHTKGKRRPTANSKQKFLSISFQFKSNQTFKHIWVFKKEVDTVAESGVH
jgi:hypothetical protein